MQDKWQKLEEWLAANAPRVLETLNPPATESQIANVEAKFGCKFPPSVRESYLIHNGQPTALWGLFGGNRFMSLEDVVEQIESLTQVENNCYLGVFDAALMIPLVDLNHSGDFLYVENSVDGAETELIKWWHEEPTRDVKAASFITFFDDFIRRIEADEFIFHVFEPHPYSNNPPEFGLLDKAELERLQKEESTPASNEVVFLFTEEVDEKMIHLLKIIHTFKG